MTASTRDAGYQRYAGLRRPAPLRWRVIARQFVTAAWRPWWRFKAPLGFAILITCACGALLYEPASNDAFRFVNGFGYSDVLLAMSIEWYCRVAFLISLTLGAPTIAEDVQTGAFTFYFSRAVRPRDYLLGKLAGSFVLNVVPVVLGPILLSVMRLGLYGSLGDLMRHAGLLARALVAGLTVAVPYTVVPLGFSALAANKRDAMGLWAGYYLVFGTMAALFARSYGGSMGALDLPTACLSIAFHVFNAPTLSGRRAARGTAMSAAIASLALQVIVSLIVAWVRVSRAQRRGLDGAG